MDADLAHFWAGVRRGRPAECWPWKRARLRKRGGYGQIRIKGRLLYAHRVALEIKLGRPIVGMACHSCDNPPCCNPAHLFEGTAKSNAHDAAKKGRIGKWRRHGERNPAAKLTRRQVATVRRLLRSGESKAAIGQRFGVTRTAIYKIAIGENWPASGGSSTGHSTSSSRRRGTAKITISV